VIYLIEVLIVMEEMLERIKYLEGALEARSAGFQWVYEKFTEYKLSGISKRIEQLNQRFEHYEKEKNVTDFCLDIQPYPFNIRVSIKIRTNFGEISQINDYPPSMEYQIGNWISGIYRVLLNQLYDEHEKRGGKFLGEKGFKEFLDENGKTVIDLEPKLSTR
jgi:hypothetical protein